MTGDKDSFTISELLVLVTLKAQEHRHTGHTTEGPQTNGLIEQMMKSSCEHVWGAARGRQHMNQKTAQ